jgi:hypothetical protein
MPSTFSFSHLSNAPSTAVFPVPALPTSAESFLVVMTSKGSAHETEKIVR